MHYLLSNSSETKQPTFVRPDLTPLQRKRESILLKERRSLIQSGKPRNSSKIHNSKLFLDNQLYLYGFLDANNVFQHTHPNSAVPTESDVPSDITALLAQGLSVSELSLQFECVGPGGESA